MKNTDEYIDEVLTDWTTPFFDDVKDHEELFDDDGNYLEKSVNSKIDAEIKYIYNELDESLQIDTGSIDDFNKERINETTGQKVKNYVDNDTFCNAVILWNAECKAAQEADLPKPPMPDVIGMQMIRMAEGLSRRFNFRNYCVDTETEALTQRGWLNVDQITTEDIILSMDPSDGKLKWSKIYEIFRNDNYEGEMFKLEGSTIDALVTPGHKFLVGNGLIKIENINSDSYITTNGISVDAINNNYAYSNTLSDVTLNDFTIDKILLMEYPHRARLIDLLTSVDLPRVYKTSNEQNAKLFLMLCVMNGLSTYYNADDNGYIVSEIRSRDHYVKDSPVANAHYKGTIWCPRTEYGTFMCRRGKRAYITGNTYIDEMREDGVYMAIRAVKNFDPTKGKNAFGYFNRVLWQAFCTRIKIEKEENEGKMSLLKDPMYLGYTAETGGENQVDKDRLISIYDN